jgi:hypothetical protein
MIKKLKIWFWKNFAKMWDLRPRLKPTKYSDYSIARTPIADSNDYSVFDNAGMKVLYEWDEKGRHWIVFSR